MKTLAYFTFISLFSWADLAQSTINIWQRQAGSYWDIEKEEISDLRRIQLSSFPQDRKRLHDIQYSKTFDYRGVPLSRIISKQGMSGDLIILHFHNGMRIPLPRAYLGKDSSRLHLFLATAIRTKKGESWGTKFPKITRPNFRYSTKRNDPRPISFRANKLVVNTNWYPQMGRREIREFSPWRHADSLVGIEFAQRQAYYEQFAVGGDSLSAKGFLVFRERCQFCHAVRGVGGRFGWDFVDPLKLHEKRDATSLWLHVKYRDHDAVARGLMMPNQKDIAKSEVIALWTWMKTLAGAKRLPSYSP